VEHLYFVCPATGQEIDVGIATELQTLLRIRGEKIRMRCPVCSEEHEWRVSDAHLEVA
jgi:hypothetical protein